jgi:hypothetical protein
MNIIELDLLDKRECVEIVNKVLSLESTWTDRTYYYDGTKVSLSSPNFFTLGSAAYLDGPDAHTNNTNELIDCHFSDILEKLRSAIETTLNIKVFLDPKYSYPGFHIFKGRDNLQYGTAFGGALHKDFPHITSKFPFKFDINKPVSFTLALEMPKNGGGLNYWKETNQMTQFLQLQKGEYTSSLYECLPKVARVWVDEHREYEEYKEGTLYIHDGQTLHQLANEVASTSEDYRITLQGHGVYREEGLMIYL